MSQVRENSKIPRRSAPGDELHVVAGTSTTSTTGSGNSRSGPNDNSRPPTDGIMLENPGHSRHKGSPEMAIYIGIPRENEMDDSDPPVENFNLFQYEVDDDEEDDEEEDETFTLPGEDGSKGGERGEDNKIVGFRRRRGGNGQTGGRYYRKRKKSGTYGNIDANYVPPYKKRFRRQTSVLPTKFLLGGNIRDPLNLASLADAKINAELNAETPKSSPVPIPLHRQGEVPVFIPKNPDDPLGLQCEAKNPHDFIAGIRNNNVKGRKRHRRKPHGRKRTDSECSVDNRSEDSDGKGGDKDKDNSMSSEEDKGQGSVVVKEREVEQLRPAVVAKQPVEKKEDGGETKAVSRVEESAKVVKEDEVDGPKPPVEESKETKPEEPKPGTSNASAGTATKKRARTRRRNKKYNAGPMGQLLSNIFNSRQTSDYVPLGTPSVHEPSNWYQFSTPGRSSDGYPYEYQAMPFESPSLANFSSDYIEEDVLNPNAYPMEPFSPPPVTENKRRRIEEPVPVISVAPDVPKKDVDTIGDSAIVLQQDENENQVDEEEAPTFLKPQGPAPQRSVRKRFRHKGDPIVSPVVPQPGCRRRFGHGHGHHHSHHHHHVHHHHQGRQAAGQMSNNLSTKHVGSKSEQQQAHYEDFSGRKYRRKDQLFQYGNYNRYYGYRSTEGSDDIRLRAFSKDFFANKDVLDVGCNIGHITLTIARDYGAKMVTGIDIDPNLIQIAKKNVKHYVDRDPTDETIRFPHSCPLMYGVLQPPPANLGDTRSIPFPYNVSFRHENYVLDSDELLNTVEPEHDIILCLSITKWVHLNAGDDGLKRFFRRTFLHLRPGGKLVLEPQPWSSYKRKKKLTESIFQTFKAIRFYPDQFQDYLIKEVGYSSAEKLNTLTHHSKGFQRPLIVFTKPGADIAVTVEESSVEPSTADVNELCQIATSTTSPAETSLEVMDSSRVENFSEASPSECAVSTSAVEADSPSG